MYNLMTKLDIPPEFPSVSPLETDVRRYFLEKAKKQPKRERTRALILDAIVETIARHGLDGTTIREIVETASVSHGTFYNHFENRDDAIRVAAMSVAHEIVATISDTIKRLDVADEAIVAATYSFMAAAIKRPSWAKTLAATVVMLDATIDPSSAKLEQLIAQGYSSGIFRVPVTPLLSLQVRAIQALAISKAEASSNAALSQTCEAILRLLGRTPAEAEAAVKTTLGRFVSQPILW